MEVTQCSFVFGGAVGESLWVPGRVNTPECLCDRGGSAEAACDVKE